MNEQPGKVFSIAKDNAPQVGCTISKLVSPGETPIFYFSLAENTDIMAEFFPYHKMIIVSAGEMQVTHGDREITLQAGDILLTCAEASVGMNTCTGCIYTECEIGKEAEMNDAIKAGEAFKLADLLQYQEGKIVNMDVVHNDKMKFAMMAFDAGQGLSPHSAPGDALVFALDGEATIEYEGTEHIVRAGENFHFAKDGLHSVKANTQFKMALLIALD